MLKKLLTLTTILLLASCTGKAKRMAESQTEVIVEDKSEEQNNYQSVTDEQQAEEMDEQAQAEIDKQIQEEVEEVEVKDRVLFDYDSAKLTDEAKAILDIQTAWLKSDISINFTIEGHCDERGTREYNIALGEKRALAAKSYLTANGIDASRIKTISYGKERPAFFGKAIGKNRRAVVVIN